MTPIGALRLLACLRAPGARGATRARALTILLFALLLLPTTLAAMDAVPERMVVEADEMVYNQDAKTVSANGHVRVLYKGKVLEADRVVYNQGAQQIFAEGHAKLTEVDGSVVRAQRFEFTDEFKAGQ